MIMFISGFLTAFLLVMIIGWCAERRDRKRARSRDCGRMYINGKYVGDIIEMKPRRIDDDDFDTDDWTDCCTSKKE